MRVTSRGLEEALRQKQKYDFEALVFQQLSSQGITS